MAESRGGIKRMISKVKKAMGMGDDVKPTLSEWFKRSLSGEPFPNTDEWNQFRAAMLQEYKAAVADRDAKDKAPAASSTGPAGTED